ncbi:hypothetical protein JYT79_00680 [Cardiobacterium sp. AH-315-I02]|nr:hypothetical protein [Cardiobacterium sp. AH-315-I02]
MQKFLSIKLIIACLALLTLSACSMNKMMVNMSMPMIESGMEAMNQEADLQLAEDAMPANISMLNGMIHLDPENVQLHVFAAQAYYGLSYGFNEDRDSNRAGKFYMRGLKHGLIALKLRGLPNIKELSLDDLEKKLKKLDKDDVATIFWTASNWGKWIDLNRDDPASLIQLPKPTAMMQRVLELDDSFYYGGAHMYFGVYYGSRPPIFGGDFALSRQHFDRAREINNNKLLIVDLLHAQYLSRQMFDQGDFRQRLKKIINAPEDIYPELTLLNQIARRKAQLLLSQEAQWF